MDALINDGSGLRRHKLDRVKTPGAILLAEASSSFADGESIYREEERAARLYRVELGAVRICRTLVDGKRHIVAFNLPGEWFGFEENDVHHFAAEAVGLTRVRSMRATADLRLTLLPMTLQSLLWSQEHQLVIGRQGATARIAAFLIEMAERQDKGGRFELVMSRLDIADYLSLTTESVSRAITKLRQQRAIRLHGSREVEIVDRAALQALCC